MAVYPKAAPAAPGTNVPGQSMQAVDIEAWTEQATQSLNAVSIASPGGVRGTSVSLAIDLDEENKRSPENAASAPYQPRRKLIRRDSLERREALLKGKEGSRRRTRWENDRLLNNPWAQPPLPSDWEIRPTYPRRSIPYYLAPLWDQEMAARAEATRQKQKTAARKQREVQQGKDGEVPKELREKLRKARAAKGLLRDLEEQVRVFVNNWNAEKDKASTKGEERDVDLDSSDDEIVFVGRSGKMRDMPSSPKFEDGEDSPSDSDLDLDGGIARDKLMFDGLAHDRGASFGRWLVHSIATYYGLRTWSRTIGDPARREAYVGIPPTSTSTDGASMVKDLQLPRPLWGMV